MTTPYNRVPILVSRPARFLFSLPSFVVCACLDLDVTVELSAALPTKANGIERSTRPPTTVTQQSVEQLILVVCAMSGPSSSSSAVPVTGSDLFLSHSTLQSSSLIHRAIAGNFSAPRAQEIVAVYGGGQWLALLRPDDQTGHVQTICKTNVFGVIRTIQPFRLIGTDTQRGRDRGRRTKKNTINEKRACVY